MIIHFLNNPTLFETGQIKPNGHLSHNPYPISISENHKP